MLTLHNALGYPKYLLGTYRLARDGCYAATKCAIAAGYLGVDTGSIYRNEAFVAAAIQDSKRPVFMQTKVQPSDMGHIEAMAAFEGSLKQLTVPAVDMLLINWPGKAKILPSSPENRKARIDTWRALEEIYRSGKAKAIGVSNFTVTHLKQLMEDGAEIVPMVNQFEVHVQLQQADLVKYCREHKIIAQAYSPFGGQGAPVLKLLGDFKHPAPAVALKAAAWLADSVVLKSATPDRIVENFKHANEQWELSEADWVEISKLEACYHYCWNPYTVA